MTKDVLVSVRGAHIADGETNNLEVITAGSYYFKNGKHYICLLYTSDAADE